MDELRLEYLPVEALTPYENNTRKHEDYDVGQVAVSIEKYSFNDPIGVWGPKNIIVEGHGRLMAAKRLGITRVPVIHLDHLSDEERREYTIMHNKFAELSHWDLDKLAEEAADLAFDGFDIDWDFELEDEDEPKDVHDDEYVPVPPAEPKARPGKVYRLGRHYLVCGDSTKPDTIDLLMDGAFADMVFTDPPWNVDYGATHHPSWKQRSILNDHMSTEAFREFLMQSFKMMNRALKPGAMTYVVMSAQEWGSNMLALAENGFHWSSTIIWKKDSLVLSRKDYHTQYEPIWYGWKDGESRLCPLKDRKQSDVWDIPRPKKSDEHPTMKPVELVARAIQNSTKKDGIVLDLFRGSGTTLIAAEQTGRTCYMTELDPKYIDVIIDRFEKLTGIKAEELK